MADGNESTRKAHVTVAFFTSVAFYRYISESLQLRISSELHKIAELHFKEEIDIRRKRFSPRVTPWIFFKRDENL